MSKKNAKSTPNTNLDRDGLTAELERIRKAREAEEKSFKDALEALYENHRKAMKSLAGERESAWTRYSSTRKAVKKSAKKAKAAPKAAEEVTPEE